VNIQHSSSLASGAANDEATGTVINQSANTKFYNINIKNTYGKGSQAIALAAYNTQQGYYGVGLYGYQDTLLSETGNQVYGKCYIEGAVDFIFGQHAVTWIDSSDIRVSAGGGAITANGRSSSSDPSYYVINKSSVDISQGSSAGTGSTYLGRPWSQYARVVFQNTVLGGIINGAGWEEWSTSTPNTADVTLEVSRRSLFSLRQRPHFIVTLLLWTGRYSNLTIRNMATPEPAHLESGHPFQRNSAVLYLSLRSWEAPTLAGLTRAT
jgi:pectinesterase